MTHCEAELNGPGGHIRGSAFMTVNQEGPTEEIWDHPSSNEVPAQLRNVILGLASLLLSFDDGRYLGPG